MTVTHFVCRSIFFLFMPAIVCAQDVCVVIGYHEPNTQTYDGPTFCHSVTIDDLTVRGPLTADHSHLNGSTTISGPIAATQSQFDSIVIPQQYSSTTLTLQKNTLVKKTITFLGTSGNICLDDTSKIMGSVVNGTIEKSCTQQ